MTGTAWVWTHFSFMLVVATALVGVGAGVFRFQARLGRGPRAVGVAAAVVLAAGLSIVPCGVVDVSGWLLAHSGELSFVTLFYLTTTLAGAALRPGFQISDRDWHATQWFWAVAGFALYGAALTGRGFDLYSTGYDSALAWLGLIIAAVTALAGRWLIATLVLGVVVSWQMRLSGAVNGWDYAIDPFIFVGSVVQIVARSCGSCRRAGTKRAVVRKLEASANDVVPAN